MTTVAELGEFGVIDRLTRDLETTDGVVLGVGDDTAILTVSPGMHILATCDAQVQDTHFRLDNGTDLAAVGWKALAVNLSDIAAMGGRPRYALVSLLLPPALDIDVLAAIYNGLREAGRRYDTAIVGGNIGRHAERLILDITLLGECRPDMTMRRDQGRAGEKLLVTGAIGEAALGLLMQERADVRAAFTAVECDYYLQALHRPIPRVEAGMWLATQGIRAGMDISDGLVADLGHLCKASGVGAIIERAALGFHEKIEHTLRDLSIDPMELVLFGGEDYEILTTVSQDRADDIQESMQRLFGLNTRIIGTLTDQEGIMLQDRDSLQSLPRRGWDHMIV